MRRISDLVEEHVLAAPLLEQALADGIINHSALARRLRPAVERVLLRPVSEAAVVMALKRLGPRVRKAAIGLPPGQPRVGELTVRSNLVEFTFHASATIREKQRRLLARLGRAGEGFVTYTQGVSEAMLIVSAGFERTVQDVFAGEHLVARIRDLSAIVIRLSASSVATPGVYYAILKQLAWRNVNVVDVVSTHTEFTIVIENVNLDAAFAALRRYAWAADPTPPRSRPPRGGRPGNR